MDVVAIQGLAASLKTAVDVSKALFDLKPTGAVQAKVAELQSALLAAQNSALVATSAQFELQERVRDLEAKLSAADDWNAMEVRYALATPWRGAAQAYVLKKAEAQGEEPHFLCANCFHAHKRVILNPAKPAHRHDLSDLQGVARNRIRQHRPPQYAEELLGGEAPA